MNLPVLVTGATGAVGTAVMQKLAARGIPARGMTRRDPPADSSGDWIKADLVSGDGVDRAVSGSTAIIHCASDFTSADNDMAAIATLIAASKAAGGVWLVNVGIAGIDRAAEALPYYATKLAVERSLAASGLPHATLRATQFFPFVDFLLGQCDDGTVLSVPSNVTLQPVALEFVADKLIDCALAQGVAGVADVHGPETLTMEQLGRAWLDGRSIRREMVLAPAKDGVFLGFSKLEGVAARAGGPTWRRWLAEQENRENPYAKRFATG